MRRQNVHGLKQKKCCSLPSTHTMYIIHVIASTPTRLRHGVLHAKYVPNTNQYTKTTNIMHFEYYIMCCHSILHCIDRQKIIFYKCDDEVGLEF